MTKFFRDHPAILVTMFWAYMAWSSLMWETAYLRSFGITPVDYGTLQDILTLAFRRPENLLKVIGGFAFIYVIPFMITKLRNEGEVPGRDFVRIFVFVVFVIINGFAVQHDAEYRAENIKKITPDTIFDSDLNYLVIANMIFKKDKSVSLENQVIVSKLGGSIFIYNPSTEKLSILNMSEIERIEVVQFSKRGIKNQPNKSSKTDAVQRAAS